MPDRHPRRSGGGPYRYVRFEVLMDARWREGSSGSTPSREDPRNAAVTAACHEIVRYLESLPDDDPRLKLLEDASEGCIRDPDHNEARAARIGFRGGPPADPSAWLDVYVAGYAGPARPEGAAS